MAGHKFQIGDTVGFIDYEDGNGRAVVDGKVWQWSFHEYFGPLWLNQDGTERKCQCPTNKKVWAAFEKWLSEYLKNKAKPRRKRKELAIK